jgi:hypothetical protein
MIGPPAWYASVEYLNPDSAVHFKRRGTLQGALHVAGLWIWAGLSLATSHIMIILGYNGGPRLLSDSWRRARRFP